MTSTTTNRLPRLTAEDMCAYRHVQRQLNPRALERFKAITDGGAIPLHLGGKQTRGTPVIICSAGPGHFPRLKLPDEVKEKANAIKEVENTKLAREGAGKEWIDGEKLAVHRLDTVDNHVFFAVLTVRWSEIVALKDRFFEEIARLRAFKLDTNNHVTGKDGKHEVLLIAKRGRKPGNRLMGSEMLHAPIEGAPQLTLASNGSVEAETARAYPPGLVWAANSFNELKEEVGLGGRNLCYLGTVIDPHVFIGAMGIVGIIKTEAAARRIIDAKARARDGCEIEDFDVIPMEMNGVAAYLTRSLDIMLPQLITGLAMLGYQRWGDEFLFAAERRIYPTSAMPKAAGTKKI